MADNNTYTIFWFRRDLRLEDNHGLHKALRSGGPVIPLFIFDSDIIEELADKDPRLGLITRLILEIQQSLSETGSSMILKQGRPEEVWKDLINDFQVEKVIWNHDYEPYAIKRDEEIKNILQSKGIQVKTYKDQVIFEKGEILKQDGQPYTIYTPYSKRWMEKYQQLEPKPFPSQDFLSNFWKPEVIPEENAKLFDRFKSNVDLPGPEFSLDHLENYQEDRNFPARNATSGLSPYLRFGAIGIRGLMGALKESPLQFKREIIWREFFMQILYHFPHVVNRSFKKEYDNISWENREEDFNAWKEGRTGYPLVDAGMRELSSTGSMHNRVRMVTASFLVKHLLVDWRLGEAYFAEKLLDYDLAANNGNWQWAAGCGCDAAPYFRIFNPETQQEKFDPENSYIKKWIPEFGTEEYPKPIIDHKFARQRALQRFKSALNKANR